MSVWKSESGQACIVLSRAGRADAATRRYEESLLEMLQMCARRPIVVVPHLYYLRPDDAAVERLRQIEAPIVLLSWLFPRAARWTLAALVGRPVSHLATLNLSRFDEPASCAALAETLLMSEEEGTLPSGHEAGEGSLEELSGEGEPAARWYPVIDREKCVNCRQCVDFCLFSVYSVESDGRVIVSHGDGCKNGCPACARVCPKGAIIFPHYDADALIAGALPHRVAAEAKGAVGGAKEAAGGPRPVVAADDLDDLMDQLGELDRGK